MRSRLLAGAAALLCALAVSAQTEGPPRSLLVTSVKTGEPLTAAELEIRIGNKPAEILRVYQAEERPVRLAVLVDDSASSVFVQSLPALRQFLNELPEGSSVLVAYLQSGGRLKVEQAFTTDRGAAAAGLRLPAGTGGPGDLGLLVSETLTLFPNGTEERSEILYIGEGTAPSGGLYDDFRLNRAIREAQERGVVLWGIHVASSRELSPEPPGIAEGHSLLESYLERLARETGGRAFALTLHPPNLQPYLMELQSLLGRQYLVEFIPPPKAKGKLEVRVREERRQVLHADR